VIPLETKLVEIVSVSVNDWLLVMLTVEVPLLPVRVAVTTGACARAV
jgi:hypothetical protein